MFLANKLNKGAGVPTPKDAQFNYVTMLLHGDGTNGAQNNTFLDSSTNNFTITRNGNTTQGSFSPYGSNWSNYFGGSDYLSLADNANLNPSTQDFVMEAWVYLTGTTGNNQGINGKGTPGTDGYTLFVTNALVLSFVWNGTGGATITGGTLVLNTWNHVAVVRNSSVIRLYLNGVGAGSSTACTTDITSTATKFVGQARGGNPILGYISNYRMTKGSLPSGYDATSSSLTVPTAPLTAISGTSLLTCQSNRFVDNSASPLTITVNGTPSVQRFNPFGTSTAYSTSVIGGSGYFDGSGDYLSVPTGTALNLSGDFTVEGWVYPDGTISYLPIFSNGDYPTTAQVVVQVASSNAPSLYMSNGSGWVIVLNSSINVNINSWNHIAVTASGTTYTIWVNGLSGGSSSASFTRATPASTTVVGRLYVSDDLYYAKGYITNVRVVKGTALYTTTFTPPTAPLTAVTNTQLLLNTTNGAIFDNAMMNDLETVGNAQISTSVKKYGTGSIALDGTGDYLSTRSTPNLSFGSGDFTIEAWVYATSLGSYNAVFAQWPDNGGSTNNSYTLETVGSNMEFYYASGSTLYGPTTLGTITTGVWIHYAICRSGNTLYPFKNGVLGTTTSITQTLNSPTSAVTVGGAVAGGGEWIGYIDDLRITKGYARYTANFTPPTAALPDIGPI
jgi:hypothetical protein